MDIIKHLHDYNFSQEQQEFIEYLNESIESCICKEKIRNKKFIAHYAKPINDLPFYNYAAPGVEPERLFRRRARLT